MQKINGRVVSLWMEVPFTQYQRIAMRSWRLDLRIHLLGSCRSNVSQCRIFRIHSNLTQIPLSVPPSSSPSHVYGTIIGL